MNLVAQPLCFLYESVPYPDKHRQTIILLNGKVEKWMIHHTWGGIVKEQHCKRRLKECYFPQE